MAWFLKLDDQGDLEWLRWLIETNHLKATRTNPGMYSLDQVEMFVRLKKVFDQVVESEWAEFGGGVKLTQEEPIKFDTGPTEKPKRGKTKSDPPEKKERAPYGSRKATLPNYCAAHPTYGGKRPPRKLDCATCWETYEKFNGRPAANQARAKLQRRVARTAE